jgi:hypothetical protein
MRDCGRYPYDDEDFENDELDYDEEDTRWWASELREIERLEDQRADPRVR